MIQNWKWSINLKPLESTIYLLPTGSSYSYPPKPTAWPKKNVELKNQEVYLFPLPPVARSQAAAKKHLPCFNQLKYFRISENQIGLSALVHY